MTMNIFKCGYSYSFIRSKNSSIWVNGNNFFQWITFTFHKRDISCILEFKQNKMRHLLCFSIVIFKLRHSFKWKEIGMDATQPVETFNVMISKQLQCFLRWSQKLVKFSSQIMGVDKNTFLLLCFGVWCLSVCLFF